MRGKQGVDMGSSGLGADTSSGMAECGSSSGSQLVAREMWRRRGVTERELAVWELAVRGVDRAAIAQDLCISLATVRTHVQNLRAKVGVKNSRALVAVAWQSGLME